MNIGQQTWRPDTALARFDEGLARAEMVVASVALAVALLTSLYTVAMRAISVATGEWVLDLPVELLVVTAIYGSGALLSRRAHMRVGFLVERLTPRAAWVVGLAGQVTVTVVCALVTWRAVLAAQQASRAGLRQPELFDIPVAALTGVAAVGFAMWTLHAAAGVAWLAGTGPARLSGPAAGPH